MPSSPQEIVDQFCSALPPKLTSTTLKEYGLALSSSTIQQMNQKLLSLSLFWMEQAFRVTLPKEVAPHLLDGVCQSVQGAWEMTYGLDPETEPPFFRNMAEQHANWERIVKKGEEPIAVFGEVVSSLELEGTIASEDRQKVLALFLDLVPIEEIGEIAGRIEEELAG